MSGNPGTGVGAGNATGVCAGSAGAGNAIADDEDDGVSAGSLGLPRRGRQCKAGAACGQGCAGAGVRMSDSSPFDFFCVRMSDSSPFSFFCLYVEYASDETGVRRTLETTFRPAGVPAGSGGGAALAGAVAGGDGFTGASQDDGAFLSQGSFYDARASQQGQSQG